jgi:predicted small secreted protein
MKALLVFLASVMLSLSTSACGGTGDDARSTSHASSNTATTRGVTTNPSNTTPTGPSFLGDGDGDNPRDVDGDDAHNDGSEDHDDDNPTPESYAYHDKDDDETLGYGRAADRADTHAITNVVERYYAAGTSDDGRVACSLLISNLARSAREDYGEGAGPSYLRGGKTCSAIMSTLFKHFRGELAGPSKVTGVRVKGNQAEALVGSRTMPASYIMLEREGRVWRIEELLGATLP